MVFDKSFLVLQFTNFDFGLKCEYFRISFVLHESIILAFLAKQDIYTLS